MTFNIQFDYRFDTSGFFSDQNRRDLLDQAASAWEAVIEDEFSDIPAGVSFTVVNPTTGATEPITLTAPIDDLLIFVGARSFGGATVASAGPDGYSAAGDVFTARISANFRGQGPVRDFEPWAGILAFDDQTDWHFGAAPPAASEIDFLSAAMHEIGHVLGIGTSAAFEALVTDQGFVGENATRLNGGVPLPLHDDESHVAEGFDEDTVALDPILKSGTRVLLSDFDKAMLADIGYAVAGFTAQGSQPAIVTVSDEIVFGTILNDTIDGLAGADRIQGDQGDDVLMGGAGNDALFGQEGHDTLAGGAQDDQLIGGAGNDVLHGGPGNDQYFGQSGVDTFVIHSGDGQNTINDFNLLSEVIQLVDSGFSSTQEVVESVTKPFSNVSRVMFPDGTFVDVFHGAQSGSPMIAEHFELISTLQNAPPVVSDLFLAGGDGNDLLTGQAGDDHLVGNLGDDTLTGNAGNDTLEGGEGVDFGIFGGDQARYTLSLSVDGQTLTDRDSSGTGVDQLRQIEGLVFGTGPDVSEFDLRSFGGAATLSAQDMAAVVELYIAYFNRAPDAVGLNFWATVFANGMSLDEMAELFMEQPETLAMYPAETGNMAFATTVYNNVLGRTPDAEGIAFWVGVLDRGDVSRECFILEVLRGAKAEPGFGKSAAFLAQKQADQDYLSVKTDIGTYFSVHKGMSDIANAAAAMTLFDGSDASIATAKQAIDAFYADAVDTRDGEFLIQLVGVLDDPFAL